MFRYNKELRWDLAGLLLLSLLLTVLGFLYSTVCGALILVACLTVLGAHLMIECYRYRRLRQISLELDALLTQGQPLPIKQYTEGELSILASQIEKMTVRLTESAEALRKEKEHLADSLADISHQLRTPLTAMNLTAAMLGNPELPVEKRIALTAELSRLLDRTDWLVETLLKLSRLDAGTVKLRKEPVLVKSILDRASAPIQIPMELRNQQLKIRCSDEMATVDLTWTSEAVGNILKNAMEHTPEGGHITVSVHETPLFTQILVEDSGPGFSRKDIPHLFERFYKGSNASESSYGIGLALARTVIAAQNGTIHASNGRSGGVFTLRFYKQII